MPDNDIRPIESDDTYTYDVQAAGYQGRARTAASQYRSTSNPSNFEPAPSAPSADPEPAPDGDDISPGQSNKVSHYDGLMDVHRSATASEVTRFGQELSDYASYYNSHIKKPGESNYQMPVSQVQPLNVVDDGAERPNESNLVSDYDIASSGYSGIAVSSSSTSSQRSGEYSGKMTDANGKLNNLVSNQSNPSYTSIKKVYDNLMGQLESMPQTVRNGLKRIEDIN